MAAHCPDCPGIIKWKVFVTSEFYIFILLFLLKQDKTEKHKSGTFLLFNYPSLSDFVVMIKGEFFNGGRGLKLMKILLKSPTCLCIYYAKTFIHTCVMTKLNPNFLRFHCEMHAQLG